MATERMSLRHIEAFRAVMVSGSMTEAARRMHTSQPQVSRLIGQLEKIAQFALFSRKGSRLTATLDGTRFYKEVEKTFVGLAGLESAAAGIRAFSAGRLTVAAMPRLAGGLLARVVAQFKTRHPDVMVSIQSGNAGAIHDWVSSGLCDLGLALLSEDSAGVQVEPVLAMNCVAVLPRGHRLARLKALGAEHFGGEPFISFSGGTALRNRIDLLFADAEVQRALVAEASLGASICAMVGAGLGISIVNPLAASEETGLGGIEVRPFLHPLPVTAALLYPQYHSRTRLVELFARYARQLILKEMGHLGTPVSVMPGAVGAGRSV
ncbi:LysR substrate-binding domain-containing protein [Variovorax sp. LT2P21]|uniref:LysR substrate-binding domain-containing protein n=1 Tax=Variovorax sp. LT2P21 TaxID=3443731 RepID=UPI003F467C4F